VQSLPENEVQINFSSYFDSFDVSIVYPNVSVYKKVSESTSITERYLVDMVSAASIKGSGSSSLAASELRSPAASSPEQPARIRVVDTITSASGRVISRNDGGTTDSGGAYDYSGAYEEGFKFDDVRQETGLGITQLVGLGTASLNGIYSRENDHSSATIASSISQSFAKSRKSRFRGQRMCITFRAFGET
jgi:hypothetical protein